MVNHHLISRLTTASIVAALIKFVKVVEYMEHDMRNVYIFSKTKSWSRMRPEGFHQIWTVPMSQRHTCVLVLYKYYIVPASSVVTGYLRWTNFSGCRKTGWQPSSLHAAQLSCYICCWPLPKKGELWDFKSAFIYLLDRQAHPAAALWW